MGNISESDEHATNEKFPESTISTNEKTVVSAIDPLDECTHPPKEGETTFLDCPFDCVGVIISYLGSMRDIISFQNCCEMMFDFFSNSDVMSRVEFNYNRNFDIKTAVPFIYRINIDALFVDRLSNDTFLFLPNLTHLSLRRALVDHGISSSIFRYLPNLEDFRITNYKFTIDKTFGRLSQKIRILSIHNLPTVYGERECDRRDSSRCSFTKVLLNRPSLTFIKLWNFILDGRDKFFFSKLHEMVNLKTLSLRSCVFPNVTLLPPQHLEEFDFNDTIPGKNHNIEFPLKKGLKRLSISNTFTNFYLTNFFDSFSSAKNEEKFDHIFQSVVHLDVSETSQKRCEVMNHPREKTKIDKQKLFTILLPTLFPNVVNLRLLRIPIDNSVVEALLDTKNFKKLSRVRLSLDCIRNYRGFDGYERLRRTEYLEVRTGKQQIGNISFIVY